MIVNALNLKILLNGIYVMEIRFFFGTDKDSDPLNVLCCGHWSVLNRNHCLYFCVPWFRVEYKGRSFMQRGGLATLIRSDVDYEVRHDFYSGLKVNSKHCLLKKGRHGQKSYCLE